VIRRVTRTYLQLGGRDRFVPVAGGPLPVVRVDPCPPAEYRRWYADVGGSYFWIDRLGWTDDEVARHVSGPGFSLWVAGDGAGADRVGYFELAADPSSTSVEIAYFGLRPPYVGRGLGKRLLAAAVERAWTLGAERVWLHTCTLDHPAALPNYVRRGFEPFKTEEYEVDLPEDAPAPHAGPL
jgi:GNAT superfamily N-acetyltransferase